MLSAAETAALIGVALSTLYKRWREWGLEPYRVGRLLKFRERHVESWLESRRVR